MVTTDEIKKLRKETGLSVMQCKKALDESDGDYEKALINLKEQGLKIAQKKKSERTLGAGVISSYIHNTKQIGVMLELNSETDFVAKNDEFSELARDIAMHIAATDPEDVDSLMEEEFIKDQSLTIKELIESKIQKFGEKIELTRFERYQVLN